MANRGLVALLCVAGWSASSACAGSAHLEKAEQTKAPTAEPTSGSDASAQKTEAAPASPGSAPTAAAATPAAPAAIAALPPQVDAGEIPRPELLAVLSRGVGRFLQRVKVSAERDAQGRFAGWQIVRLFAGEEGISPVVQAGDTLLRINGQSVERPEQLKTVWDSLVNSSELVLTVRRAGQQSEIRYRIVETAKAEAEAASPAKPKRS